MIQVAWGLTTPAFFDHETKIVFIDEKFINLLNEKQKDFVINHEKIHLTTFDENKADETAFKILGIKGNRKKRIFRKKLNKKIKLWYKL
jgi:hypothetical protein